jgi:methylase of polypeptide subunit release factors
VLALAPAPLSDLFRPDVDPIVDAVHQATACYTQDPVVDALLDLADWPRRGGLLVDAGAGDGQFIAHAIARLALAPNDVAGLIARVEAWEFHPYAAAAMRDRLTAQLCTMGWTATAALAVISRIVVEADFLAPGPRRGGYASTVVFNPPYLRAANWPVGLRERYVETVPEHAIGDLLHAFLDRAASVLAPDGVLAAVTSDRWLMNPSAGGLRAALGERFGIAACERLGAESAFYKAKTRRAGSPPRVHPIVVLLAPISATTQVLGDAPFYPGAAVEIPDGARPLGELAMVRLAPYMGPDGVFSLDTDDAAHLPSECLVPCVDAEDVGETALRAPHRVAIRTSRDTVPPDAVLAHLKATREQLPARARREPFWLPAETWGPLPLAQEALLVPRVARAIRSVRLPAGVLPINHQHVVLLPHGGSLAALEAALTAPHVGPWLAKHAHRIEGGFYSITTTVLRQLPIVLDPDR